MRLEPVTNKTLDVLRRIRNSCAVFMTDNPRQITEGEQRAWWADVKDKADYHVYLLRHDAMDLFYGYGIIRKELGRWWLTGGLIRSRRGCGLGATLFNEMMNLVEADGSCCWLQVRRDNVRARRLYARLGFVNVGPADEDIMTMRTFPTLKTCETIYNDLLSGELEETRPEWLRNLPHARDDDARYYRFFWELSKLCGPLNALEIGTDKGVAAAHLAGPHPGSHVVTIDHNPACKERVMELGQRNILPLTMDSTLAAQHDFVTRGAPYDVIFIDGNHTYNQATGEYALYRPFLREGGLMFFDDIDLRMETLEMQQFWREIEQPKLKLPKLHHTGFGVVWP